MTTWRDIPGWCDFEPLYRAQVEAAAGGAQFVEIGAWLGKSACLMGSLIRESGKSITFDAIEHGLGSPELMHLVDQLQAAGTDIFTELQHNIAACGLEQFVRPIYGDSLRIAERYAVKSLDFVFIDGNHGEESVAADVEAWLPKMKPGGIIAGHDWRLESVRNGVCRHINPMISGSCWLYAQEF